MKDMSLLDFEEKKPSKAKRALVVILVTALVLGGVVYGGLCILFSGQFVHAAAAFVQDVGDSPVGAVVLNHFLAPQEQERLLRIDPGTGIVAGEEKLFSVYPNLG